MRILILEIANGTANRLQGAQQPPQLQGAQQPPQCTPGGFWAYFLTFLARDLSQQVRNGRRIHMDRVSAQTVDSGPISDHFWCFCPDSKIRAGPKLGLGPTLKSGLGQGLAQDPQQGLPIPDFFSGPHSGTFFCKLFVAFPGNSSNNVDPADPTLFVAFPGTASNFVDKNPDLTNFWNGAQKKVPEPPGLVGGSGPLVGGLGPSLAQT